MPKTPLGRNFYNGLALPSRGESEMRQEDSSRTILTFTHSSDNTGRFVTFRDYVPPGSSLATTDVAAIDADGGFVALSGSSVKFEMNTSGLYQGSTAIVNSSGELAGRRQLTTISGATTLHVLTAAQAGQILHISTQAASSVFVHLPSSGTAYPGMTYEFVANTTASDLFHFMTTGANAGGIIHVHIDSTNTVETTGAVTHASSGALWLQFVCLSTAGPEWACCNKMAHITNSTIPALFTLAEGTTA